MPLSPLSPPTDSALLQAFLSHFRLSLAEEPYRRVEQIATAFSQLPYENLSKIIRYADAGSPQAARELPADVLEGHFLRGTGGTCFSLTASLLHLLRAAGLRAEPVLADRSYGPDTHCALLVWIGDRPHLIDPGFLLVQPVPLSQDEQRIATPIQDLLLTPRAGGERLDLATVDAHGRRTRLMFKTSPVDAGEFLRAWDASFDWDMMHYPVLTRVAGGQQLYLRDNYQQIRGRESLERRELPQHEVPGEIQKLFGIDPNVIQRALQLLERQRSGSTG